MLLLLPRRVYLLQFLLNCASNCNYPCRLRLCRSVWVARSRPSVVCLTVCVSVHSITQKNEWSQSVQTWCRDIQELIWFCDWKVKDQGHRVNNITQWHFISNYNRASFTFARWRYQYYMLTTVIRCHSLGSDSDKSNTAWVRTQWLRSSFGCTESQF